LDLLVSASASVDLVRQAIELLAERRKSSVRKIAINPGQGNPDLDFTAGAVGG
jgi:hypothetical protein